MTDSPDKIIEREKDQKIADIAMAVAPGLNDPEIFVGGSDFRVARWNLTEEKPEASVLDGEGHESYVTGLVRNGETLVSCSYDGTLCWWDIAKSNLIQRVEAHEKWIRQIALSPDGKHLASVADDMRCHLWDAQSGEKLRTLEGHALQTPHHYPSMLYAVAWSPDGEHVATADRVGTVHIWRTDEGKIAQTLDASGMYTWDPRARRHSIGGVRSVAFSPDGATVAVGGMGDVGNIDHLGGKARVEIFDRSSGERKHTVESVNFKGLVERLLFSRDGKTVLATGGDHKGFVALYDVATGELLAEQSHDTHVHDATVDESGKWLTTVGHQRITRWSLSKEFLRV